MREISYSEAIRETLYQTMEADPHTVLFGQGVSSPWYVGNTTLGLEKCFGERRVIDTPVSENCIAGSAVGCALAGIRTVLVFPRMDFMLYAMDQILNHAANWRYMFGGKMNIPLTIWAIINRGGEQAAQHSQAFHAIFAHIPGLKIVAPSDPYDAKGLLNSCLHENNPIIYVDDRWLYNLKGSVPEEPYTIPIGKGIIRRKGKDITIVANSYMVQESMKSAIILEENGIDAEVIDLRSLKPIDVDLLIESVSKTKRMVVADGGWKNCGFAAEISATISELRLIKQLKAPIFRVALPDSPAPASRALEKLYYKNFNDIVDVCMLSMEDDYVL